MKRGELWVVELPNIGGHETFGYRPALVLADTSATNAVVAPLTSNLGATRFAYTRTIEPTKANGLAAPSALMLGQLRTIDKTRLGKNIGKLNREQMGRIELELMSLFGI